MAKTVILGSARTPVGKLGGGLASLKAVELGGIAIEAALERADVEGDQVDHVVMGNVLQAGVGQIPSRQAQINGGIPKEVSAARRSTRSAPRACAQSACSTRAIRAGDIEVGVGGGMESMSNAPYLLPQRTLRLQHGRRQDDRRDDQRRTDQPLQRQAHGPRGQRGRGRDRDDPRRHGQLVGPLARAARSRPTTRASCPRRSSPSRSRAARATPSSRLDESVRPDTTLEGSRS